MTLTISLLYKASEQQATHDIHLCSFGALAPVQNKKTRYYNQVDPPDSLGNSALPKEKNVAPFSGGVLNFGGSMRLCLKRFRHLRKGLIHISQA